MTSPEKKQNNIQALLKKELGIANIHQVPYVEKVVVNMGIGKTLSGADKQQRESLLAEATKCITLITGQKPETRLAKQSIAGFKLREGEVVGLRVTLRKQRMYDFIDRLVKMIFPRVRDFRGLPLTIIDPRGILNIGMKEHVVFPELSQEEFRKIYGIEITVVPSTRKRDHAIALYRAHGFPLRHE